MSTTPSRERDELLTGVRALTNAVNALDTTLKNDYPKRAEVRRGLIQLALLTVAGLVGSSFVTVAVISGCFLSPKVSQEGNPAVACQILPGYSESVRRNHLLLKQFNQLLVDIEQNRKDIARLERKVGVK
jgi:hypothetical protein